MARRILYLAPTLPILTCTFIYREIFDLRDLGLEIDTVSMNTPPSDQVSEEAREFLASTLYLDQVPEMRKFFSFFRALVSRPLPMFRCLSMYFTAAPMQSFRDYRRLGYHLIEASYLVDRFKDEKPDHIHSHFINGPTSISMFLAELLDVPFSFTMHASAIWVDPIALVTKLQRCRFCVSISDYNRRYVAGKYGKEWQSKINVVHCGISMSDVKQLPNRSANAGSRINVLAVGQLVKRKGYDVLVDAARILRERQFDVGWTIVGEGEQRPLLERMIERHKLQDIVTLVGAKSHEEIPRFVANADIFTLPCVIGDDNTRDGIPVALMEAMACRLPVVSTNIVGLPELIESGHDGILVEPNNPDALAGAIAELAGSAALRQQIGEAAADKVDRDFNAVRSAKQLAHLFNEGVLVPVPQS